MRHYVSIFTSWYLIKEKYVATQIKIYIVNWSLGEFFKSKFAFRNSFVYNIISQFLRSLLSLKYLKGTNILINILTVYINLLYESECRKIFSLMKKYSLITMNGYIHNEILCFELQLGLNLTQTLTESIYTIRW